MESKFKSYLRRHLSRKTILWTHKVRAIHANFKYGFPSRNILTIGVTGTKGKTTTCHFLASILEEAGYTVGMITTVGFKIGDEYTANESNKSSLNPYQLQELLSKMKATHCNVLIIEVTSHGIDQYRDYGIPFKYVGLTNITHDHLDYHPTWADYQATKLKLFTHKGIEGTVVNGEDASAELFLEKTTAPRRWVYSTDPDAPFFQKATDQLFAQKISTYAGGSSFNLVSDNESLRVNLQIPGRFTIENALCATALCLNLNLKIGTIVAGLEKLKSVPGRLEKIETRKGFTVMIDYAHTPDSLERLYSTLKADVRGKMIAVLGSCGDRDRTKRPIMGSLAARFCDLVFVTDEEPYTEDPLQIIEEISKGVPRGRPLFKPNSNKAQREPRPILRKGDESGLGDWWWKVPDRREAISRAIEQGKMDDMIIITGMGAQKYKIVGDQKIPWVESEIVTEILKEKNLL